MAFPFRDIMRVRLARVLIMRVIMRKFMRRMSSFMRGAFSPSKALPTYYARASGPPFDYAPVYAQHYARSSLDYARCSVGWYCTLYTRSQWFCEQLLRSITFTLHSMVDCSWKCAVCGNCCKGPVSLN